LMWLVLMWLCVKCCRRMQAASRTLVVERERQK
jgi:hypothetical protein